MKVLYIEDAIWQIADTILVILKRECEIKELKVATSFAEAKGYIQKEEFHLIIADILLEPKEKLRLDNSVLGLIPLIKEKRIPIIIVSAFLRGPAPDEDGDWEEKGKTIRYILINHYKIPEERIFNKPLEMKPLVNAVKNLKGEEGTNE